MFKFKKSYLRVLLIAAVCCAGVAIGYKKIKAVQDINIVVDDNAINAENNAPIYWNTNIEANCGIDYSINSDLSGGIGTNGKIIQVGLPTNDGKFYYVVNLSDLQPGIDYYYRVNCNTGNDPSAQSEIKKLSKYDDNSIKAQESRDTRRIYDIKQIQRAIELYFNDLYKYPEEVKAGKNIYNSANGTVYMSEVPGNPKHGGKEYFYKSNKSNYELIFELERDASYYKLGNGKICVATILGIKCEETNGNSNANAFADKTKKEIENINNAAKNLNDNKFDQILTEIKVLKDVIKEQQSQIKYLAKLTQGVKNLSEAVSSAINNFITYGVDDNTKKLGEGERAAVMHSYKAAFAKLPETEDELADAIKIANGRWPSMTNDAAEKKAKEQFQKIYKRIPDMNDAKDNAAVTVMAYGLRQRAENRNLNSEKAGINIFKGIYKKLPETTEEWNMMQAITYSGAAREKDTDGDLLPDWREDELGTNKNKKDTDGDGYSDGVEVLNGFDPLKK